MINIKNSTQTWSNSVQQSALKPAVGNEVSPEDYKKAFGSKDLGEVLNKVADPNWVDPAKTRKVGNNELDRDAFLKLLLAQLKNQDPTNPMENHQMAAQLAQFSSLESLGNIDKGIGDLTKAAAPKSDFAALGLIGKGVSGDSSRISRTDEKETHDVAYDLLGDASDVKVKIMDANNQTVRELSLSEVKKGKNELSWNGLTEDGQPARAGEYRIVFEAVASNGVKVGTETKFEGTISGVNFTPKGPLLLVGNQSIQLSEVKKIVDPSQLTQAKVERQVNTVSPSAQKSGPQTKRPSVPDSSGSVASPLESNLETVGMSREMVNEMKKQGIEAGL